jgi:hypothetical protein
MLSATCKADAACATQQRHRGDQYKHLAGGRHNNHQPERDTIRTSRCCWLRPGVRVDTGCRCACSCVTLAASVHRACVPDRVNNPNIIVAHHLPGRPGAQVKRPQGITRLGQHMRLGQGLKHHARGPRAQSITSLGLKASQDAHSPVSKSCSAIGEQPAAFSNV